MGLHLFMVNCGSREYMCVFALLIPPPGKETEAGITVNLSQFFKRYWCLQFTTCATTVLKHLGWTTCLLHKQLLHHEFIWQKVNASISWCTFLTIALLRSTVEVCVCGLEFWTQGSNHRFVWAELFPPGGTFQHLAALHHRWPQVLIQLNDS